MCKIIEQLQSDRATLLGMELYGKEISNPDCHGEGFPIFTGRINRLRVIWLGIKRVDKIEFVSWEDMAVEF